MPEPIIDEKDKDKKDAPADPPKDGDKAETVSKADFEALEAKYKDLAEDAQVLYTVIQSDNDLKTQIRTKVQALRSGKDINAPEDKKPEEDKDKKTMPEDKKPESPVSDPKVDDLSASQRNTIIESFYKETGLAKLPEDRRKEISQKIEKQLNTWNHSVVNSSLTSLPKLLKDAFELSGARELNDEERAQIQNNTSAAMPGISAGGAPAAKAGEVTLTEDQASLAKRWGLDPERVKARIKADQDGGDESYGENTLPPIKKDDK